MRRHKYFNVIAVTFSLGLSVVCLMVAILNYDGLIWAQKFTDGFRPMYITSSYTKSDENGPSGYQKWSVKNTCSRFEGKTAETCMTDLLAMAWNESRFDCSQVGDQGRSYGCFQIQTKMHKVSVEDAQDFQFAANWTLNRMVKEFNYPTNRTVAIQRHNGSGIAAVKYANSVKSKSLEFATVQ